MQGIAVRAEPKGSPSEDPGVKARGRRIGIFSNENQANTPTWQLLWDRPDPRGRNGPRDQWSLYWDPLGSIEAWPIVWVWSTLLTQRQRTSHQQRITAALEALTALRSRIVSPRARLRSASRIDLEIEKILEHYHLRRYVKVSRTVRAEHAFKQTRRGRPGAGYLVPAHHPSRRVEQSPPANRVNRQRRLNQWAQVFTNPAAVARLLSDNDAGRCGSCVPDLRAAHAGDLDADLRGSASEMHRNVTDIAKRPGS